MLQTLALTALAFTARAPPARMMAAGLYELKANRIDGSELPFSSLEGKPVVMANVASR